MSDKVHICYEDHRKYTEDTGKVCDEPRPDPCGACCFNAGYAAGLHKAETKAETKKPKEVCQDVRNEKHYGNDPWQLACRMEQIMDDEQFKEFLTVTWVPISVTHPDGDFYAIVWLTEWES